MKKLILGYKTFLDHHFLTKIHPLRYLFLEITRVCNLRCSYCGSNCTTTPQSEELASAEWIDVIGKIAKKFNTKKIMVAVTGGEPLMKEGIFDILRALNRQNFRFGMVTNGTLLSKKIAKELVATGIGSISVSLDAPAKIADLDRGSGVGEKVISGIKNLQQTGYRGILEVISTITTNSFPHLEDTYRLLKELGIKRWRIGISFPLGRALTGNNLLLSNSQIKEVLDFVKIKRKENNGLIPELCEEGFLGCNYENEVRPYYYQCYAGITIAGIKCDGTIGACPELGKEFDQGNIKKDDFFEIWQTKYKKYRDRSWMKKGICSDCQQFSTCRGNSLHLWDFEKEQTKRCYKEILSEDF